MKKILTIIGARPQFIKSAAVSRSLASSNFLTEITVHTGQHYDPEMSDIFFNQLGLPRPAHMLDVHASTHGAATGMMLVEIEKVMLIEKPDYVLVYGDTNSTLAGALSASKLHIPLLHVEAGLRSFNTKMPEEINRKLTDHISSLLFATSVNAEKNLLEEGIDKARILITGDVMQDCVRLFEPLSNGCAEGDFILCTLHRQENVDNPYLLSEIGSSLKQFVKNGYKVIFPIHPRTLKMIKQYNVDMTGIDLMGPVGYLEMLDLIKKSAMVMTDSGGLQKEAYYLNKKCITLRKETEWIELINEGYNKLVPDFNFDSLKTAFDDLLKVTINKQDIYGNGYASQQIVTAIENYE